MQAVAYAGFGDDEAGADGVEFDFAAEVADVDAQEVGLVFVAGPPNVVEELAVGEDLAGVQDEYP